MCPRGPPAPPNPRLLLTAALSASPGGAAEGIFLDRPRRLVAARPQQEAQGVWWPKEIRSDATSHPLLCPYLHFMTVLQLGAAAWLAGLLAYLSALAILYRQGISGTDLRSVAVSSLVVFGLCYWLLYLPVLRTLRRWLPHRHWVSVFPLVAMLVGILPTALVARFWGGSLRALLTPEAGLFYVLFGVVGLVIGLGFTRLHTKR